MKLPLWRLIAALLIFGGMIAVLAALGPTYLRNFQLQQYVKELSRTPAASNTADDILRRDVLDRAHGLRLPLEPGDIQIVRQPGALHIQAKYAVQVNFGLYEVDLHFR